MVGIITTVITATTTTNKNPLPKRGDFEHLKHKICAAKKRRKKTKGDIFEIFTGKQTGFHSNLVFVLRFS